MPLKAVIVGAVESSRIAIESIARASRWSLELVLTLPPELAHRHDDYVDLASAAAQAGARLQFANDINSDEAIEAIRAVGADYIFVIGWSQICGDRFRAACKNHVIGFHPAPLPRLRGRAVIPWTIINAEPISAGTLFWIDEGVDTGPIIAQHFFHIADDETATTLYSKQMIALAKVLDEALPRLADGTAPQFVQDNRYATWASKRTPADGIVDWSMPADEIERLIRAVTKPYAGASTFDGPGRLALWSADVVGGPNKHLAAAGRVVAREDQAFTVMCGDGSQLRVTAFTSETGRPPRLHSQLRSSPCVEPTQIRNAGNTASARGRLRHA